MMASSGFVKGGTSLIDVNCSVTGAWGAGNRQLSNVEVLRMPDCWVARVETVRLGDECARKYLLLDLSLNSLH